MTALDPRPGPTPADTQPTPIVWAQPATYDSAYDEHRYSNYSPEWREDGPR